MELNSSTFILEIINFLVLVWILKRFFYKPVLDVIARRKAGIDDTVAKADALQKDAQKLQQQYEERLADWELEKQRAQRTLDTRLQKEREAQMRVLQADLEAEREKEKVLIQRQLEHDSQQIVETALQQGAQFASHLLSSVAGPELEKQLVALLVQQLKNLPAQQLAQLRKVNGESDATNSSTINSATINGSTANAATITSAYPLDATTRQALELACKENLSVKGEFIYRQDPAIIAGLRINIAAWVLATNLQDELSGFVGFNHEH
ncbi:MAG: F0F1 ATP synthase subunit delta [Gammaproteobacteria bacterium]|nr:F0F1 ATP synthase subunit delta [Gammaproteobacteria bacterium]MBQ0838798.1 F0F1 ATP synthase subunit delta [Gammaproteobacteria bacterium]